MKKRLGRSVLFTRHSKGITTSITGNKLVCNSPGQKLDVPKRLLLNWLYVQWRMEMTRSWTDFKGIPKGGFPIGSNGFFVVRIDSSPKASYEQIFNDLFILSTKTREFFSHYLAPKTESMYF